MAISNKVGPPVTGDDFYGRIKELAHAHELLDSNHSLVLSAPRRIGKSSFAKRLIEDKEAQGWKCVYIDLEGIRTKEEFLLSLITQFDNSGIWTEAAKAAGGALSSLLECVKGIGPVKLDFSKQKTPENLYQSLSSIIDHKKDTLIVIDELTLFLGVIDKATETTGEASFFLNWFRSLRQVSEGRIRWIFCGSVGLHNFTRIRNLSMTINDLVAFDFDALSNDEARGLISALSDAEHIPFSERMISYLLDKIEWHIPYFIQLLFTHVKNYPEAKNGITEQMIDSAFVRLAHSEDFSTWSERLSEYNGQENGARLLLKELCRADNGLTREQLLTIYIQYIEESPLKADNELSIILNMIEHDGYIMRANGGLRRFRSPLLKKWWYYKFVE